MRYRAIFSDVDGTLINSKMEVTENTQRAIEKWVEKGIPFTTVSARSGPAMIPIRRYFSFPAYQIIFSGALIEDPQGNIIYKKTLGSDYVHRVYEAMEREFPDVVCTCYTRDIWYTPNKNNELVIFESGCTEIEGVVGRPKEDETVYKFLCMGEEKLTDIAVDRMRELFSDLTIYKSNSRYIEILSGEASKSTAISFLLKGWKLSKDEIIAFGDSFNDIDMMKYAGLGIAMGNAVDEVKASADVITQDNDHDGIVTALDEYMR